MKPTLLHIPGLSLCLAVALTVGCDREPPPQAGPTTTPTSTSDPIDGQAPSPRLSSLNEAIAYIMPPPGIPSDSPRGTVRFVERDGQLWINANVFGLPPGKHGFYIYEYGNLTNISGGTLGQHFNPQGITHGDVDDPDSPRKPGALGNLVSQPDLFAVYSSSFDNLSIAGDVNPILGRAVVITDESDTGQPDAGQDATIVGVGLIVQTRPEAAELRRLKEAEQQDNDLEMR